MNLPILSNKNQYLKYIDVIQKIEQSNNKNYISFPKYDTWKRHEALSIIQLNELFPGIDFDKKYKTVCYTADVKLTLYVKDNCGSMLYSNWYLFMTKQSGKTFFSLLVKLWKEEKLKAQIKWIKNQTIVKTTTSFISPYQKPQEVSETLRTAP